jgi:uncharacterized OB-fold protein
MVTYRHCGKTCDNIKLIILDNEIISDDNGIPEITEKMIKKEIDGFLCKVCGTVHYMLPSKDIPIWVKSENKQKKCPKCGSCSVEWHTNCYYCYDCGATFKETLNEI